MRILRYITMTVLAPFVALLIVLALVSSFLQLGRLGEVAFGALGDMLVLVKLSAYVAPSMGGVALPVALLVACLIAYDRLSDSSELFAFASCGASSRRIFMPCVIMALPVAILAMIVGLYLVPWGISSFLDEMAVLTTRSFARAVTPKSFVEVLGTTAMYTTEIDESTGTWHGVFLAHAPANVERELMLFAPEVAVTPLAQERAALLDISRGEALLVGERRDLVERVLFGQGQGQLDLQQWARRETAIYYDYQGHGLAQLIDDASIEQQPRERRKIQFFMWQKLTLPFACFPLAFIGALLGAGRSSESRARAYVWGILIAVLFFVGHEGARGLAVDGHLAPALAASLAGMSCMALCLWLWFTRAGLRQ